MKNNFFKIYLIIPLILTCCARIDSWEEGNNKIDRERDKYMSPRNDAKVTDEDWASSDQSNCDQLENPIGKLISTCVVTYQYNIMPVCDRIMAERVVRIPLRNRRVSWEITAGDHLFDSGDFFTTGQDPIRSTFKIAEKDHFNGKMLVKISINGIEKAKDIGSLTKTNGDFLLDESQCK